MGQGTREKEKDQDAWARDHSGWQRMQAWQLVAAPS